MRILMCDDSKIVHSFVADLLKNEGFELQFAFDGDEVVERLDEIKKNPFDAMLLDWEMARMSGIQTLKALREGGYKGPIIMVTTKNSHSDIEEALRLGVTEYIMKPFTKEILLEKIEMAIGI